MAKLKITQVRSRIGSSKVQKATLDTLGLRKMHQSVEREGTPSVLGLVQAVRHLVTVEEVK
ncbi:50S ribosomal protein L30 [Alistipes sp. ZOR0009]|jgi:large subunit ribosomal protein L30|uniref:50S ribosomal protein L30 n=1 Tax=Alistipes sp. ZOR0009 TaxID=1339253 RepID=UPI00064897BE|nr:50S ribosomal protein L30 [Alistipes sp. ZOR0009]